MSPDRPDPVDDADVLKDAWERTLADMRAMATEREEDGWRAIAVGAGHTAPESPMAGDSDRFGLVHVVPGDRSAAVADAVDGGTFPSYRVFRRTVQRRLFLLTELRDPGLRTVILVAGVVRLWEARPLIRAATDRGEMYTHLRTLDGTHVGSFRHDEPSKFFPRGAIEAALDDS